MTRQPLLCLVVLPLSLALLTSATAQDRGGQDRPAEDRLSRIDPSQNQPSQAAQEQPVRNPRAQEEPGQDRRGANNLPGPGVDRELMWPAPTAEDWKRPCLITFQRTWEDALAVARETGRPILICVNMDGEIASEHYAGVRYREPEKTTLYEPYVCVIASVYRHSPRDYDEHGRRILCPRFGSVTCGEHIAIEPVLYEQFFDGRRIAPRHIMVELDGKETYDVYYAWDTDSVFSAIRDGIANRPFVPATVVRGDRPIVERVASRDIRDRQAVENAYEQGDQVLRQALLEAARRHDVAAPVDLLRLGVFGLDVELSQLARGALAQTQTVATTDLIADALRVPMEVTERDALINALGRLGESSPRARTLAVVHRGLVTRSKAVDVEDWTRALAGAEYEAPAIESYELEARLRHQGEVLGASDPQAHVELAEAFLARAFDAKFPDHESKADEDFARCYFTDALRTALEAEKIGATGWRVNAVIALAAYYLKDPEEAHARAEAAVRSLPSGEQSYNAMAVLELFAKMRCQAIAKAVREKQDWPSQWLTDVNAACSVLARHPLGTDAQIVWHYDILRWLGGKSQASRVLDEGLSRFPDSWALHDRLRGCLLAEKGIEGLEVAYEEMLRVKDASPNLEWYAGYASLVTAEFHRRRGNDEEALEAYNRGITHYEHSIAANPDSRETADHYVALAMAGRARLAYERGDYERALGELVGSFERKPEAAGTLDGLNISPADTARMLLAKLTDLQRSDLVARLEAALDKLDPELLALPAYEGGGPGGPMRGRGPGRRARPERDG
ncbi:MAG: hypothetical protein AB1486_02240 [Planctomycetota bacterium]